MTQKAKAANQVRIGGGLWRSRVIRFPGSSGLRPTPDRVRETLFNWLGQRLDGKICLDLFAGSGALGFEALSRGASEVVMVEQSRQVAQTLKDNGQLLTASSLTVLNTDALQFLRGTPRRFNIVFLDPPFQQGLLPQTLNLIAPWLADGALVYAESELGVTPSRDWKILKQSRAGQVNFWLMMLTPEES
ncbi:MAG: 16S rRNA (guanine(966)-N(2))-methyltransferase RsmD [Burkholderiales bacterium]